MENIEPPPPCPQCHQELEVGDFILYGVAMRDSGFVCRVCNLVYTNDLCVLARLM
jgi:transposase-like protein